MDQGDEEERKMFVGGLASQTTDETLREYFLQFGDIVSCVVKTDEMTQRSRGFGFIVYSQVDSVKAVVSQEHEVDGKQVEVKRAKPATKSESRTVFIGGLKGDITEADLRTYFTKYGNVESVKLHMAQGFGFMKFDDSVPINTVQGVLSERKHTVNGIDIDALASKESGGGSSGGGSGYGGSGRGGYGDSGRGGYGGDSGRGGYGGDSGRGGYGGDSGRGGYGGDSGRGGYGGDSGRGGFRGSSRGGYSGGDYGGGDYGGQN